MGLQIASEMQVGCPSTPENSFPLRCCNWWELWPLLLSSIEASAGKECKSKLWRMISFKNIFFQHVCICACLFPLCTRVCVIVCLQLFPPCQGHGWVEMQRAAVRTTPQRSWQAPQKSNFSHAMQIAFASFPLLRHIRIKAITPFDHLSKRPTQQEGRLCSRRTRRFCCCNKWF